MNSSDEPEVIPVPRELHERGTKALADAASVVYQLGVQLARMRPDLHRVVRLCEEGKTQRSMVDELRDVASRINVVQVQLVAARADLVTSYNELRACDPELTPVRPPSRPDMKAAFKNSQDFAEKARK